MNAMDTTYRKTAAAGASGFSLLIALYDTLAGDLRRAAAAQRAGNLEQRAKEVKHAILVVGYLENWIDAESGELARKLIRFYSNLRRGFIEAQVKQSAELMEKLMAEVLTLREVWQRMEDQGAYMEPQVLPPITAQREINGYSPEPAKRHLNWSA